MTLLEPCFFCILAFACDILRNVPVPLPRLASLLGPAQSLRSLLQTRTMFKSITAFSIGGAIANCHWSKIIIGRFGALPHRLSSRSLPLHASHSMRTDCLTYEHSLCFDSISSAPPDNRELRVLFPRRTLIRTRHRGQVHCRYSQRTQWRRSWVSAIPKRIFSTSSYLNESSTTQGWPREQPMSYHQKHPLKDIQKGAP